MHKSKVSIIIAAYNVGRYLNQTMLSAVNQTLKDIEIICVDDGSTDNTKEILNSFAAEDARVKIIQHEVNKGLSITRKDGVLASTGEYILLLDGDDYLDINACKDLYRCITKEKVDIFQFGTTIVPMGKYSENELSDLESWLTPYNGKKMFEYNGDLTNFCYVEKTFGFTIWNKIYNGDIVRKAFSYMENHYINLAEDVYHFFFISFFAKSYASTNKKYYYYNWGTGMTGGKQITNDFFEKKAERGRIVKYLSEFTEKLDPDMNADPAIDAIYDLFTLDATYDLLRNSELLDIDRALETTFLYFDKVDILSSLTNYFYSGDYITKKHVVKICKNIFSKNPTEKNIKTIGIFYHRMENGGVERVISQLIPIYLNLGYRIVLFTDEVPSFNDYDYPDSVIRIILPKVKTQSREEYKKRFEYYEQMIKKYNVDSVVYHAWIAPYLLLDLLAIKSASASFIVHTHGFFAYDYKTISSFGPIQNILLNDIYGLCDAIVTLSDVDYNWWAIRFDNVYKTVNPLSFDTSSVTPSQLKGADIIWVGRISPEKKPVDALKIIKTVIDSGHSAKLHFIGKACDEVYHNFIVSKIREMGLEDDVIMHGFHKDVSPYFKNASIYLHTSEFEGFSMTIVESKAYGLPAVIYDLPNLDMVKDKKGMLVVNQGDIKSAAKEIIYLLENPEERMKLGKTARESFELMYSFDISKLWKECFSNLETNTSPKVQKDSERLGVAIGMMLDFTAIGIEEREKNYYAMQQNVYDFSNASENQQKLEEIYNMRTWKIIQKYRNFMDNTFLGKVLSKIRDVMLKK